MISGSSQSTTRKFSLPDIWHAVLLMLALGMIPSVKTKSDIANFWWGLLFYAPLGILTWAVSLWIVVKLWGSL